MPPHSSYKLDSEASRSMAHSTKKMTKSDDRPTMEVTPATPTEGGENKDEFLAPKDGGGNKDVASFDEFLTLINTDKPHSPEKPSEQPSSTEAKRVEAKPTDGGTYYVKKVTAVSANKDEPESTTKKGDEGKGGRSNTDDTYVGSVDSTNPAEEDNAPSDDTTQEDQAQESAEPSSERRGTSKVGGGEGSDPSINETSSAKDSKADLASKRRPSSEKKAELHNQNLLTSVNTVDSWGGKEGSLPPLNAPKRSTMPEFLTTSGALLPPAEVSDLEEDGNPGQDGPSPPSPQDNPLYNKDSRVRSWYAGQKQAAPNTEDSDDVAKYINFNKLLQPSSSEYYYSRANRSNRELLNKVKSTKKPLNRCASLDDSHHSRVSLLSQRSSSSVYRGPKPLKRDGSNVKGVIKKQFSSNLDASSRTSGGSLPEKKGNSPKAAPRLKRCSFSSVDIREHERVAGDNPCVTSGVPLSIGWGYYQHDPIALDDYEYNRGPARDKIEMMVPAGVRKQMLRHEFGVSVSELNAAMKEVNVTKRHRRNTVASEHLEGWQEVLQSAKRKFKRLVKGTSTKKEEEKMWAEAHKSAMNEYLKSHGEGSLGKNAGAVGAGPKMVGPKIAPENSDAPMAEISFHSSREGEAPPSF